MCFDSVSWRHIFRRHETEAVGQYRVRQVEQFAPVELHPRAIVRSGFRVKHISMPGNDGLRRHIRGLYRQQLMDVAGRFVIPVQDFVKQFRSIGMRLPDQVGGSGFAKCPVLTRNPIGMMHPSPRRCLAVDQPQPVRPERPEGIAILAPNPGQFTNGCIGIEQFRPQGRHLLGQLLHQPQVFRTESFHAGNVAKQDQGVETSTAGIIGLKA